MRTWFERALVVATIVVVAFFTLPILSLFFRTSPTKLFSAMTSRPALDAILVSLRTSVVAHVFVLALGTPAAYFLATRRFRGRGSLVAAIDLPLVLPPAVAGIALLSALGRRGIVGAWLAHAGITVSFSQVAVVLAVAFVSAPFYIRQAIAAFAAVDPVVIEAARSLGAGPWRTFRTVSAPLAAGGLRAGSAVAWARGLGEFGATIMFAGNFPRVTQTLPLAIYSQLDQDFNVALAIGVLLVVVSAASIIVAGRIPVWTRSRSTSQSLAADS